MRIRNMSTLTGHGNLPGRLDAARIMEAGLEAADPYYNALALCRREGDTLTVGTPAFEPVGDPKAGPEIIDLSKVDRVFVFGAGKGVQRIALALEEVLGKSLTGGRVIIKHNDVHALKRISVSFGGHPVPDAACVSSARELLKDIEAARLTERDMVFTIIGNGASSLLTLPPDGVSLESVMQVTQLLQIEKGLPTDEVNKVRNQVDLLKGGRLTRKLFPAKLIHIEAIDVNEFHMLGGFGYDGWTRKNYWLHTLPDLRAAADAIQLLQKHDAWERVSPSVRSYLQKEAPLNPCLTVEEYERSGGRFFGVMSKTTNFMKVAADKCRELGYEPHVLTRKTGVEASAVGKLVGRIAVQIANEDEPFPTPCALLLTGEMLVSVGGQTGIGGRNQECCAAAAGMIAGQTRIVIAAADTDGTDGPGGPFHEDAEKAGCTILAGGIVDGFSLDEAKARGVSIDDALRTHATSNALWRMDSGIWATQNISLNDLVLALIMKK